MLAALQAELDAERLNAACDALTEAALQRGSGSSQAAAAAAEGAQPMAADASEEAGSSESTQRLLQRAEAAQRVGCTVYCW